MDYSELSYSHIAQSAVLFLLPPSVHERYLQGLLTIPFSEWAQREYLSKTVTSFLLSWEENTHTQTHTHTHIQTQKERSHFFVILITITMGGSKHDRKWPNFSHQLFELYVYLSIRWFISFLHFKTFEFQFYMGFPLHLHYVWCSDL